MRNHWKALMAATALISSAAFAQAPAGDIRILSGGVGASDRAMIESQQNSYALKLVFSGQGGAFLAGVHVTLADKDGTTIVSTVTDGPILLVAPPAGTYTMTAVASGIEKRQSVTAGSALRTYQISFPIRDDEELTSPDGTYLPKAASALDNSSYYAPGQVAPNAPVYAPAPAYAPHPHAHPHHHAPAGH